MQSFPTKKYLELLDGDSVTEETRRVLQERLNAKETPPRFFDEREFEILKAVCETLAPSKVVPRRFVAQEIDKRLSENAGNSWRYAEMPPDGESYKTNLQLLEQAAQENFQTDYVALEIEKRREILKLYERDTDLGFGIADFGLTFGEDTSQIPNPKSKSPRAFSKNSAPNTPRFSILIRSRSKKSATSVSPTSRAGI